MEIFTCRDGSHTLYSSQYRQYFHNPNGAVEESNQVFLHSGGVAEAFKQNVPVVVLETGFGTGLNLLLMADLHRSLNSCSVVSYHSIEGFLIDHKTFTSLNYAAFLKHPDLTVKLSAAFNAPSGFSQFEITGHIRLILFNGLFKDFEDDSLNANFIFHDPFSPEVNPELWTSEVFEKLKMHAAPDALMSTYCAASRARAAMAKAGWFVARAPGAAGKREMTLASPEPEKLTGLKRVKEEKLIVRFYPD